MPRLYLPSLRTGNVAGQGGTIDPPPAIDPPVTLSEAESALLWELQHHPDQQRRMLKPHHLLMQVARAKAQDMATRGYVGHVDPDGYGPNYHVLQAGYVLPAHYQRTDDANNVESLAAGQHDARSVLEGWSQSVGHWTHVMGRSGFYRDQVRCGIGFERDLGAERYGYFWCLVTAPEQK